MNILKNFLLSLSGNKNFLKENRFIYQGPPASPPATPSPGPSPSVDLTKVEDAARKTRLEKIVQDWERIKTDYAGKNPGTEAQRVMGELDKKAKEEAAGKISEEKLEEFANDFDKLVKLAELQETMGVKKTEIETKKSAFQGTVKTDIENHAKDLLVKAGIPSGHALEAIVKTAIEIKLKGIEKEALDRFDSAIKAIDGAAKLDVKDFAKVGAIGKQITTLLDPAHPQKLPDSMKDVLAKPGNIYPKTNKITTELNEYVGAVKYLFNKDRLIKLISLEEAEKNKGKYKNYLIIAGKWQKEFERRAGLGSAEALKNIVEEMQKAEGEITKAFLVDEINANAEVRKTVNKALDIAEDAELTPAALDKFFKKYETSYNPAVYSDNKKLRDGVKALFDAIKTLGLESKVQINIEGEADATPIDVDKNRAALFDELAKAGGRLQAVGALWTRKIEVFGPDVVKEVEAFIASPNKQQFLKDLERRDAAMATIFTKGGGVLNTLLAYRRTMDLAGDDVGTRASATVDITAHTSRGRRRAGIVFSSAGSSLYAPSGAPTPPTDVPSAPPVPPVVPPVAPPTGPAPAPGETPAEKLERTRIELKTLITDTAKPAIDAANALITTSTDSTPAVLEAKTDVETTRKALEDLITSIDIDHMEQTDLDDLEKAIEDTLLELNLRMDILKTANEEARQARERMSITTLEEGMKYTDSYGKTYKFEGGYYYYDGTRLTPYFLIFDPKAELEILTGRRAPSEIEAKKIAETKIPGIDLSKADIQFTYSTTTKQFEVTLGLKGASPATEVKFQYTFGTGLFNPIANSKNVTKFLKTKEDPSGSGIRILDITPGEKSTILSNNFAIDATRLAEGLAANDPQKQILEWINAGDYRLALYGDPTSTPSKPGLLDATGNANAGASIDQIILCFENDSTITGPADKIVPNIFTQILPKLAVNINYNRIKSYITDATGAPDIKKVLTTILGTPEFKGNLILNTIRTDVLTLTDADGDVLDTVIKALSEDANLRKGLLPYNTATTSNDKLLIDLLVKRILTKGEDLPAYLLSKINTFADFLALSSLAATIPNLSDANIKAKLGNLIIKTLQEDDKLHTDVSVANFATLCEQVWGTGWKNNSSVPAEVRAAGEAIALAAGSKLDISETGLWNNMGDKEAYLKELFRRIDFTKIDISKINANPDFIKNELIPVLEKITKDSPKSSIAAQLLTHLLAENTGAKLDVVNEQIPKLVEQFKLMEKFDTTGAPGTPYDVKLAIAEEMKSVPAHLKAKVLNAVDGVTTRTNTDFDNRVKRAENISLYDKAVKEQKYIIYSTIDFTDTGLATNDPRVLFVKAFKDISATSPVAVSKDCLDLIRNGQYPATQLENLITATSRLITVNMDAYLELAIASGLQGYAEGKIKESTTMGEHLKNFWLSKLYPAKVKEYLSKAYEYIVDNAATVNDVEELKVIEAMKEAHMTEVTFADGTVRTNLDDDTHGRLRSIEAAATSGSPEKIKALQIIMEYEADQCGAGEQQELMTEIDKYVKEKTGSGTLTEKDYQTLQKAIEDGACRINLTTISGNDQARWAYGRILYHLAIRTPPTAETAAHIAKFKALPESYFEATSSPERTKWEELNGADILSTNPTTQTEQEKYVKAAIAPGSTPTDAQLITAAKWVFNDTTPGGLSAVAQLDILTTKASTWNVVIQLYLAAPETPANGLTFNDRLKPALDICTMGSISPAIFENLANAIKAHADGAGHYPDLLDLIVREATYMANTNIAVIGRDIIDIENVPPGAKAEAVWTAYQGLGNPALLKDVTRKLVTEKRSANLSAITTTTVHPSIPPAPGSPSTPTPVTPPITGAASRTTRDLRDDIYDAYAPSNATEANNVKKWLGIDT